MECLPSPWPRKGTGLLPAPVKVRQFSVSGVCSAPFSLPESKQYGPLPSCSLGRGLYCFVFMWRLGKNGGGGEDIRQHRTIPALRLKHRSDDCGTASALPKCSIMSGCGTRIVLRGLCDRCPCFGSLFPPLAALTFAVSSIICAFGLASAAPRSPYRHLELCGIAFDNYS